MLTVIIILQLIAALGAPQGTAGAVKFDCLTSFDHLRYREAGVPVVTGFSGATCPDHYFVSNIEDAVAWGKRRAWNGSSPKTQGSAIAATATSPLFRPSALLTP